MSLLARSSFDRSSLAVRRRTSARRCCRVFVHVVLVADVAVVWARAEEGILGFLVERDMKGFSTNTIHGKYSLRASDTGELVEWDNVSPSVMLDAAGIKVGIIGLVTFNALQVTATGNTVGLEIAPLAEAAIAEAEKLREYGAAIIIITAHAGGSCAEFDDPNDTSTCRNNAEIMRLANDLPNGLVDLIVAGHEHDGIAHNVNGVAVVSAFSNTRAFDRVDFTVAASTGEVLKREIFPPQLNCPAYNRETGKCEWLERDPAIVEPPVYEGTVVKPTAEVQAIVDAAVAHTEAIKSEPLGVFLEDPFIRDNTPESAIARLFTDAILEEVDADISIHNTSGGIRADLQPGPLTFGDIYQISPFDN